MVFTKIENETFREYIFPTGRIRINNVTGLHVRDSGSHRLETGNSQKFIIPAGWIGLEIGAVSWSA